jgi:ligand-binding sensor domain-containing protein
VVFAAALSCTTLAGEEQFNIVKPSTTGVPGEECRVMTIDPEGNLWVAARWPFWGESALAMLPAEELPHTPLPGGGFDTGVWRVWSSVHYPQGFPSPFINDIEFSNLGDGIIWIGSGLTTNVPDDGGLMRFDPSAPDGSPEQWTLYNAANSPLNVNGIRSIDQDSQGNLWLTNVANVPGGVDALFRFNPVTDEWTQYTVGVEIPGWDPPWTEVNSVMVGADDHVYVTNATLPGFAQFDGEEWIFHGGGTSFDGMLEDQQGNIWFTTGGAGVWKWNGASFQSWTGLGGTSTVTGLGMLLDGTVCVSTWYGDIFRMVGGTTPQFFFNADNIPRNLIQRPDGDIWINNYGGNGTLGTVRHYTADAALLERFNTFNSGLPWYFIDNIQTDNDGNLWFACGEGGLSRMLGSDGAHDSPTRWRNWGNHNDLAEPYPFAGNEPMYSIYDDGEGYIWMGGNGISKWDKETGQSVAFWNWENSSLGVDSFVAIAQDANDDIWIASDYTGVYRLNPETNDWEQHLFGAAFATVNWVQDMVRDLDGNLWVATYTSLFFFNGQTWFGVGPIHGSPVEGPTSIEVHPDGSLWIGALNGLIKYEQGAWTIYDETNSPMPTSEVKGLDIRNDGLIGFTVADFDAPIVWPHGVVLFDGETWEVFSYGTHPLPHYQLDDVEFDAEGDIWVSTISEGVTEIVLTNEVLIGDFNGDGAVGAADLAELLAQWGECPTKGPCIADIAPQGGDGEVGPSDLAELLARWG